LPKSAKKTLTSQLLLVFIFEAPATTWMTRLIAAFERRKISSASQKNCKASGASGKWVKTQNPPRRTGGILKQVQHLNFYFSPIHTPVAANFTPPHLAPHPQPR
jgi:hypothetical protein